MLSYLATATLAFSLSAAAPEPIVWQADYDKALAATREGRQPLLVVLDDPEAQEARLEPELMGEGAASGEGVDLLRPYRLCHVDVSTEYGKKVAKAFKANEFPYTAVIDKTGSVILYAKAGAMNSDQWQSVLKAYRYGERESASTATHTAYKIGGDDFSSSSHRSPNYCPSCQRRSM